MGAPDLMDTASLHLQPDIQVALLESVGCIGSYVAHLAVEWELHAALLGHFVALLVGPLAAQSPLRPNLFGTVGEADGNDVSPLLKQERLFGGDGDCLFLALRNVCYERTFEHLGACAVAVYHDAQRGFRDAVRHDVEGYPLKFGSVLQSQRRAYLVAYLVGSEHDDGSRHPCASAQEGFGLLLAKNHHLLQLLFAGGSLGTAPCGGEGKKQCGDNV